MNPGSQLLEARIERRYGVRSYRARVADDRLRLNQRFRIRAVRPRRSFSYFPASCCDGKARIKTRPPPRWRGAREAFLFGDLPCELHDDPATCMRMPHIENITMPLAGRDMVRRLASARAAVKVRIFAGVGTTPR